MPILGRFSYKRLKKKPFASCSWREIARIAQKGLAAKWFAVGDKKPVTLTSGEALEAVILGFSHDDLANGGGKAPLTISFVTCLAAGQSMNSTITNEGSWKNSELRAWMQNEWILTLPAELRTLIKSVFKWTSAGSKQTGLIKTEDTVWLLSEREIFGETTGYATLGEGEAYPYYSNVQHRIKTRDGSQTVWWERSPAIARTDAFCYVKADGTPYWYPSRRPLTGVCPAFCI